MHSPSSADVARTVEDRQRRLVERTEGVEWDSSARSPSISMISMLCTINMITPLACCASYTISMILYRTCGDVCQVTGGLRA